MTRSALSGLLALTGLALSAGASAQSWQGFYIDGAIGARSTSTTLTNYETNTWTGSVPPLVWSDTNKEDFGNTNFLGEFSAGYRFVVPGSVVIGVGAFVDAAGNNAGKAGYTTTFSGFGPPLTQTDSFKLEQTSRYGISLDIAPDWRTQPYAKVSYAWSKFKASTTYQSGCFWSGNPTSSSTSATLDGWGFGAGVRHLQSSNLYFFAEVLYQDYGSTNRSYSLTNCAPPPGGSSAYSLKLEPSNVVGVIGLGFKF